MTRSLMPDLPSGARWYVSGVILAGLLALVTQMPPAFEDPALFVVLVVLSAIGAAFKIRLPLYKGGSTLSVSFAFDFTAILLLDLPEAMLVSGIGAWAQCSIGRAEAYPLYRTVFSITTVILSAAGARLVFTGLGGQPTLSPLVDMVAPVLAAGTTFFIVNSLLVGVAIASSTGESLRRVWYENLLWSAPGYIAASIVSAGIGLLVLEHGYLMAPAVFLPAYLSYHAYEMYVARIQVEQQHVLQVTELHKKATEALQIARMSEAALAAEKERLSVTLRSIADGVITADIYGRVILLNRVAEQLTGWTQEEATGQPMAEVFRIVHRETAEPLPSPVEEVLRSDLAIDRVTNGALVTGARPCLIDWSATPMHDNRGAIIGVVVALRDVTSEVRIEEERAKSSKLESLGILAGGIAHDFNNIMTAVVGNLSLVAMSTDLDQVTTRRIHEAERACERAKSLTKQLLTFSKGGAPVKSVMLLGSVLEDAARFALRGSNVRCEFEIGADLWPVEADAGQITQVINNVVLNSKQAMPGGGVVRLSTANVLRTGEAGDGPLPSGEYIRIRVDDPGTGIPAHLLSKVFDPYFTTRRDGSGLGLASSYSIVHNHGGHISLESTVGQGTTVDILLPRSLTMPVEIVAPAPTASLATRGRVLVMDDEESIRELAGEMLECLGYEATVTRDGDEAIRVFEDALGKGQPFSVVIMDLTIPGGMGGKDAIRRVREIDDSIRAIVSSGYADDPVMADHVAYGFDGVVAKPYTLKDLQHALDVLLNTSV